MEELRALQNRITELEKENAYLKSLLNKAGISYSAIEPVLNSTQELYDKNQGNRIIPVQITHNHVRAFFSYFWGRMDVFSKRYQNKTSGKAGYFTQCNNFWKSGLCPKASGTTINCRECKNRSWTKLQAFHIELMTESCQHYAVVDKEIVWYGSMNLLSKDDIEDNIMRVLSKAIAEELLEMTFRKDNDLNEYQLPLDII